MPAVPVFLIGVPFVAAMLLGAVRAARVVVGLELGAALLLGVLALCLPWVDRTEGWFLLDEASLALVGLIGFGGIVSAWYDLFGPVRPRRIAVVLQLARGCALVGLLADSPALGWAGTCGAIAAALLVTHWTADEAGHSTKHPFGPTGLVVAAGLGLALAGTTLLAVAAQPILLPNADPSWTALLDGAARCHGPLLLLAFTALVAGYGVLAATLPVLLSGGFAGVIGATLVPLLRVHTVLSNHAAAQATFPDPGLLLIVAGGCLGTIGLLQLWQAAEPGNKLRAASVVQSGCAMVAFGLGGDGAIQLGLLVLVAGDLGRLAAEQCLHATIRAANIRAAGDTTLRVLLLAAVGAMPPTGLFTAFMLLVMEAAQRSVWLAAGLGCGVVLYAHPLLKQAELSARPPVQAPRRRPGATLSGPQWHLAGAWLSVAALVLLGAWPLLWRGS